MYLIVQKVAKLKCAVKFSKLRTFFRNDFGTVTKFLVLEPLENFKLPQKSTFVAVLCKYLKTFRDTIASF